MLEDDPSPLENTVTVNYNPDGFPNDITASASASVVVEGTTTTTTTTTTTAPPTTPPPPPPPGPLPQTGSNLDGAAMAGIAALFAGCTALVAARKLRRPRTTP